MKIDPNNTWKRLEERLEEERDPVLRRNLAIVIAHSKAEAALDLDALLATVSERADYHAFTSPDPSMSPKGKPAVRKFYEDFIASGAFRLEHAIERITVDRHAVVTEGDLKMAYPGTTLQSWGIAIDDPAAYYLYSTRTIVVWAIDEHGLVIGEDTYMAGDGFAGIAGRKLALDEIGTPIAA